ncbi:chromatin assembly factor 1 subunit A-like [Anopheles bellator]|uniref:chromatin assembly factor 1 subunit A-like n=1 Tax=Anopheles bellator TaxID=139047 RepID=UPI002647E17B|nr:chromatin assembly factor 1 subunit A-like [Anopheles bellator]
MHSVVDLTLGDEDAELNSRSPGSNGRRLKQSRLSFQALRSTSSKPTDGGETRKRKPSSDVLHVDMPVAKVVRVANLQAPVEQDATDAIIAIDDSDSADDEKMDLAPAGEATSSSRNCSPVIATDVEHAPVQQAKAVLSDPLDATVTLSSSDEEGTETLSPANEESVQTADGQPAVKRKLTEKQVARRQEYERKQALKDREREEKRRKQQEEKEEKAREKEEQERQRRREREERDEQKRKEREEKDKRRQSEIDQKNEERRRKEEEREAEEKRKAKVAKAFTNFFVKKPIAKESPSKESDDDNFIDSNGTLSGARFMPFCVKSDMRLAPTTRRMLDPAGKETLTKLLGGFGDREDQYLSQLKRKCHQPIKTGRTWDSKVDEEDDDIMIVDDSAYHQIEEDQEVLKQTMKAKFFLFIENRRPPYRGTWRKRSTVVRARRPFAQDKTFFDYEVDSDDEWEEEEPGESLHGSDDEKDVDPEEDYEVDNEFFVPHGHLSDEELQAEEDEEDGRTEDNSPETQKAKIRIMQQEFVAEMKKKTEKIKPRLIGCIWQGGGCGGGSDIIMKILNDRAMLFDPADPISFTRSITSGDQQDADSPGKRGPKKRRICEEAVYDLVRLVHGNVNNRKFLAREFQAFWATAASQDGGEQPELAMESVRNKIKEIAAWGACPLEGPMLGKHCWTVAQEVLEAHNLTQLALPNTWCYQLKGSNPVRLAKPTATTVVTEEKGD